jgi:class 3 adenylate cyclase
MKATRPNAQSESGSFHGRRERVNRKLAADVVGYSRLMGADEAGTLAALKRHREAIFDPVVAALQPARTYGPTVTTAI